jgi:hypothetical protein
VTFVCRFAGRLHLSADTLASFWKDRHELTEKKDQKNTPTKNSSDNLQAQKRKTASEQAPAAGNHAAASVNATDENDADDSSDRDNDNDGSAQPQEPDHDDELDTNFVPTSSRIRASAVQGETGDRSSIVIRAIFRSSPWGGRPVIRFLLERFRGIATASMLGLHFAVTESLSRVFKAWRDGKRRGRPFTLHLKGDFRAGQRESVAIPPSCTHLSVVRSDATSCRFGVVILTA